MTDIFVEAFKGGWPSVFTALHDVGVLYPAPLRDLLMRLAPADLFRARWTDAIHAEWTRNVRRDRPDIPPAHLARTRALMGAHVRDCLVTGYERLTPTLTLPDSDDRHVLAAAIRGRADVIVTFNLKDFPPRRWSPVGPRRGTKTTSSAACWSPPKRRSCGPRVSSA